MSTKQTKIGHLEGKRENCSVEGGESKLEASFKSVGSAVTECQTSKAAVK